MAITGRPRTFDVQKALEAAMFLFWRKGFLATSLPDLCEAMGIRSPSLYAAFGSKEALYLRTMKHYAETVAPTIWGHLKEGNSARACVANLLQAAAENLPECGDIPAGCMVVSAGVTEESPPPILETVRTLRLDCLDMLRSRLNAAVLAGDLGRSTDTDRLARFYLAVYMGMGIQARDGATEGELRGIAETAMCAWPDTETAHPTNL